MLCSWDFLNPYVALLLVTYGGNDSEWARLVPTERGSSACHFGACQKAKQDEVALRVMRLRLCAVGIAAFQDNLDDKLWLFSTAPASFPQSPPKRGGLEMNTGSCSERQDRVPRRVPEDVELRAGHAI